jgi:hypothetical protein
MAGAFFLLALAGLACAMILAVVSSIWERDFVGRGGLATKSAGYVPEDPAQNCKSQMK